MDHPQNLLSLIALLFYESLVFFYNPSEFLQIFQGLLQEFHQGFNGALTRISVWIPEGITAEIPEGILHGNSEEICGGIPA